MKYNIGDVVQTMTFKKDSRQIISNKICIIIDSNNTMLYKVIMSGQEKPIFILEEEILRKLE